MASQSLNAIFRSQVDAIAVDRDVDACLAHYEPHCVFRDACEPEPRDLDGLREYLTVYLETYEDMEIEYKTVFSEGEFVVGEFAISALFRGDGADPGGTRVTVHYCIVNQIRAGLVLRETAYWAPQELDRQLPTPTRSAFAT
jgi:hypothetical protein